MKDHTILKGCFQAVGPDLKLPKPFHGHSFLHWRHPLISPLFGPANPTTSDVQKLIQYFKRNKVKNFREYKSPYINFISQSNHQGLKSQIKRWGQLGFQEEVGDVNINLFNKMRSLQLPPKFTIEFGDYFQSKILRDTEAVMAKGFGSPRDFILQIRKGMESVKQRTAVLIRNSKGMAVASGSVFVNGKYAYIFGGNVIPRYRRKGLWSALLAGRQLISSAQGAKYWMYSTTTPSIKNRGDKSYTMAWSTLDKK